MDAETIQRRFMKLNKVLGRICGIWPYQNFRSKLITQILSLILMSSCTVTQVASAVLFFNVDNFVNGLPFLVATIGTFVKVGNYIINDVKLKSMLKQIFDDWSSIKSEEEHDIMITYSRKGELISYCYAIHMFLPAMTFMCMPIGMFILDICSPLNETRTRIYVYPAYYWLDPEEYYLLILLHTLFCVLMTCVIFCACDMNYVYAVQHACGLLAVTRYRFGKACSSLYVSDGDTDARSLDRIKYRDVCNSVRGHQRVVQYLKHIEKSHHTYLFISMGMLIIAISVSLFAIASSGDLVQKVVHGTFFVAQTFHVFFLSVQGQFVINGFNDLYYSMYESLWYNSTPKTQALYILALRSCLNPPLLTAGGMMTLNLRSFAEIIKASVSYYTVMQSK
ncbi:hypothetical protein ANTQUA_LOCUS8615 [Anthophora quadrimaculata]